MDTLITLLDRITNADPAVLVTVVSVVALLVIAECVKALGKKAEDK